MQIIRRLVQLAPFVALLAVFLCLPAARAQLPPPPGFEPPRRGENALQQAEGERQHRAALKAIPDRKASNDPWRNLRTTPPDPTLDRHRQH